MNSKTPKLWKTEAKRIRAANIRGTRAKHLVATITKWESAESCLVSVASPKPMSRYELFIMMPTGIERCGKQWRCPLPPETAATYLEFVGFGKVTVSPKAKKLKRTDIFKVEEEIRDEDGNDAEKDTTYHPTRKAVLRYIKHRSGPFVSLNKKLSKPGKEVWSGWFENGYYNATAKFVVTQIPADSENFEFFSF